MSLRKAVESLLWGLVSAGFLALITWIYTTGNRVTALEAQLPAIDQKLTVIQEDVRDVRNYLLDAK